MKQYFAAQASDVFSGKLRQTNNAAPALLLPLMVLDDQQSNGVNRWLKPAKFAASIGLYLLTMAWLPHELRRSRWILATLSTMMLCSMTGEQLLITMQAFHGVTSHYNSATAFDARAATHGRRSGDSSRRSATSC